MTNEPAKPSRHNKFQLTIGVGGLPLGIPLVLVGLVLIALSPVFKLKQQVRSGRNDANQQ